MVRVRRAGGERRREVIDVVVNVLAVKGYAHTRFRDVADESGLAVSTLQGYFGSRVDMLIEALTVSTNGEAETMEALASEHDDPWRRLEVLVERGMSTPVPVWRMLMEFWCAAAHDEELRLHSLTLAQRYRQPFVDAIERGVRQELFRCAHSSAVVVDLVVAVLDGLLFPRVLDQPHADPDALKALLLEQLATTLGVDR